MNTRTNVKDMAASGMEPIEILQIIIDDGWEYPDAFWLVSDALHLKRHEREELAYQYDNGGQPN